MTSVNGHDTVNGNQPRANPERTEARPERPAPEPATVAPAAVRRVVAARRPPRPHRSARAWPAYRCRWSR